jgi:hypothetical protein
VRRFSIFAIFKTIPNLSILLASNQTRLFFRVDDNLFLEYSKHFSQSFKKQKMNKSILNTSICADLLHKHFIFHLFTDSDAVSIFKLIIIKVNILCVGCPI